MKVLFTGGAPEWAVDELETRGHEAVCVPADEYVDETKFCQAIKNYDVYVSGGLEDCTAKVIESAEKLKVIIFLGTDYKAYIDEPAAQARGIPIVNTPAANARAVAELTIMLMLLVARKGARIITDAHQQKWKNQQGFELKAKTLGLIGAGNIAHHVARIGEGLGMNVLYWTRSGERPDMTGTYANMNDLLKQSDVVSLHVPKEAGVVLGPDVIALMKEGGVLVNTAPAMLVDANALYEALNSGKLSAAAFDCFYAEGEKAWTCDESKLFSLGPDKFFVSSHSGWKTAEGDGNMYRKAVDTILSL